MSRSGPFDRLPFFVRAHREVLLYLFFGGCTFLVSVISYWLFNAVFAVNELVANVISWILAVLFAFFTNRVWVFEAPTDTAVGFWRQMAVFFAGRAVTLLVEEAILAVFVTWLAFSSIAVKIVAQVVVIVLNYVISKCVVFQKKKSGGEGRNNQ